MKSHQKGFTLIELIVVIVILGILAATALPKFIDLGGDARKAVMKGVEGSLRGATAMVYAKAAAQNQLSATGSITVNGATVATKCGYPAGTTAAITAVVDLSPSTDFDATEATGVVTIKHKNAPAPATCYVKYTAPTATTCANDAASIPAYESVVSGC